VYAMLTEGRTAGVFQMEGATNTRGIQEIKPVCFEDIVSSTSLYRTGAISAGFPAQFIRNRERGVRRIPYVIPELQPILERSWGVVLYQEQVMEMGEKLAGFSMEEVDDIKEAIKHKKSTLMQTMKPKFVRGVVRNCHTDKATATKIWQMIEGYSGYGYNRSHAVAYTMLTYQTARLKCLWPKQYAAALLATVEPNKDNQPKRESYLRDLKNAGFKIFRPDINGSGAHATVTRSGVRFGFTDLSGIGEAQAEKIVNGRQALPEGRYETVEQVEAAVRNKGVMKVLAECGALTKLGVAGSIDRAGELLNWQFRDPLLNDPNYAKWKARLVRPGRSADGTNKVTLIGQIVMVNTNGRTKEKKTDDGRTLPGKPYATIHVRWDGANTWNVRLWSETQKVWPKLQRGAVVQVSGMWEPKWENVSVAASSRIKILRPAKAGTNGSA
jgi:DNA polymerase III alpha subunit